MPVPPPYYETTEFSELLRFIKKVLEYLSSPQLQEAIFPLKITFIFISVVFIFAIIYFLVKTEFIQWWFLKSLINFLFPKPIRKKVIAGKWKAVKRKFEKSKFESQWKVSLIEGLDVFDKTLKEAGYAGDNVGERLEKLTSEDVSNLDELLEACRICQDVVRDPDYRINKDKAEKIINLLERAVSDLEFL